MNIPGKSMVSFNVKSLFTKIALPGIIDNNLQNSDLPEPEPESKKILLM